MKNNLIIILFFLNVLNVFINIYGYEFSYSKSNILLNNKNIINSFEILMSNENKIDKIKIMNNKNENKNWCYDLFKIYCNNKNLNYEFIHYNNFFKDDFVKKDYIFVNDFMNDYGRTLNQFEKNKIMNLNKINIFTDENEINKIILHIHNYDKLILKDDEFINNFEIIEFPEIDKRLINDYIYNMVEYYNYHNDILLINWKKYQLTKLNIKKIENLIFKIHNIMILNDKYDKNFNINKYENFINKELDYLNLKYYDK